ncbi:sporulation protein YqfD [Polycladomyces subterraneus]|uniref:Sporulation protein YqfD n=1 Tax=Polycladomyces subterraneus TaxID=1016997 RepID=A0ABT8IPT0_9BACL|nr:sporulation protein YqfD [Polycladomyces subterraneus]MDN4594801.1 sporulation protein YqfD [Polycladomyces subterraneus]
MTRLKWPRSMTGHLRVELKGDGLTQWLNRAKNAGIQLKNIRWVDQERLRFTLAVQDFYRMVPLVRRTGISMRIVGKKGLPFWLYKMERRKFFTAGIVLFLAMLFVMTSIVWRVDVEGNETIPDEQILKLAKQEGVYVGQVKYRLPDTESVQYRLSRHLSGVSWVGFRLEGTRAIITVVEKKRVDPRERSDERGPVNFIAKRDAMVYDLRVERGRPMVGVSDMVRKGQVLISGYYGNPEEKGSLRLVGAKGKVLGIMWYDSDVVVPLTQKRKVFTGERHVSTHLYVGSHVLRLSFLWNPVPFKRYETMQEFHAIRVRNWRLPIGWVNEKRLEMKWVRRTLTREEAVRLGMERARDDLLTRLGHDGRVLEEKVLHERLDNGKVYLKIHFNAVENIAVPQPILQGE